MSKVKLIMFSPPSFTIKSFSLFSTGSFFPLPRLAKWLRLNQPGLSAFHEELWEGRSCMFEGKEDSVVGWPTRCSSLSPHYFTLLRVVLLTTQHQVFLFWKKRWKRMALVTAPHQLPTSQSWARVSPSAQGRQSPPHSHLQNSFTFCIPFLSMLLMFWMIHYKGKK